MCPDFNDLSLHLPVRNAFSCSFAKTFGSALNTNAVLFLAGKAKSLNILCSKKVKTEMFFTNCEEKVTLSLTFPLMEHAFVISIRGQMNINKKKNMFAC